MDQLFNSTEKRLARALLRLSRYGRQVDQETHVPKISQQTLAEMVGAAGTHVNYFMNKFRRLGFIDYDGEIRIRRSLLNVVLRDMQACCSAFFPVFELRPCRFCVASFDV